MFSRESRHMANHPFRRLPSFGFRTFLLLVLGLAVHPPGSFCARVGRI
jgi:hypothetical protein